MSFLAPRSNRGTSIIAALVFAAMLGGIALGLNALRPNNPASMSAAAGSAAPNDTLPGRGSVGYTASCAQVIQAAAAQGQESGFSPITDTRENLKDSCNAALFKRGDAFLAAVGNRPQTVWVHDPNVYQCVGKSGTLKDNGDGTFTETMHADDSVEAGKCKTEVCDASGKCANPQLAPGVSPSGSGTPLGGLPNPGSGESPSVTPNSTLPDACKTDTTSPACAAALSQMGGVPGVPSAQNGNQGICPNGIADPTTGACLTPQTPRGGPMPNTDIPSGCTANADMSSLSCSYSNQVQKNDTLSQFQGSGYTCSDSASANTLTCVPTDAVSCPTGQTLGVNGSCAPMTTNIGGLTCPGGNCGPNPGPGNTTNVNGMGGGGGGIGSFLSGLARGTFGGNPTMYGDNPTGANNCNFITSIFGCKSVSCQISATPSTAQMGMPISLNWTTSGNVGYAQISGIGPVGPSGSYTVYPTASNSYTLQIQDQNGNQNSCSTQVQVTPRTGCSGTNSCTSPQTPYGVGTDGQACTQPPQQPLTSSCTVGSWQPTFATGNGCITGYQCGQGGAGAPTAQLTCSPQTAEAGQSIAIAFSCANATMATSSGFSTNGQLSGSATSVISPPAGSNANIMTYTLMCSNAQSQTASAQCSVQFNQPSIVLVANPTSVPSGQTSTIGWVTAGMKSCVVSSPGDAGFTANNANNQSVNGLAQTNPITQTTEFDLSCTTIGGQTKTASTTVRIGASALQQDMQVSSGVDGKTVNHGDTVTISWQTPNAPANTAVSLWLIDLRTENAIALIAGALNVNGSYQWKVPAVGASCNPNSPIACASDLVAGNSYGIEAALYKPTNAFLGGSPVPSGAVNPTYVDAGYTPQPFTVGQ